MTDNRGQIEAWDEHYESANLMFIPDIRVVRWARNVRRRQPGLRARALVLGCGNGRHAIELARLGFYVVAVDYSPSAISFLKAWARLEHLEDNITAVEVDLMVDGALKDACTRWGVGRMHLVLAWSIFDYFNDDVILRILEQAGKVSWVDAQLLIGVRGPRDFAYAHKNRSDGFMDIKSRDQDDWEILLGSQKCWGGDIEMTSRIETFGKTVVGGVKGEKTEHLIFIEAERLSV